MISFYGLLELTRLPGDVRLRGSVAPEAGAYTRAFFLDDLLVQPDVVPDVAAAMQVVRDRLGLEFDDLSTFVYASPFLQAECHPAPGEKCTIRLSSALVEALDSHELMFVVGHELGHFLLGHLNRHMPSSDSYEELIASRRRELSADRVGLMACQSLSSGLSAMMKTMSGLSSKHLRFNAASFIAQLKNYDQRQASGRAIYQSHPSWLIRSRALLWFSMNRLFHSAEARLDEAHLKDINVRIVRDLERYFDQPLIDEIHTTAEDLEFWGNAKKILSEGRFTKLMQQQTTERFGSDLTDKLKVLLTSVSQEEAVTHVEENLQRALSVLGKIAPGAAQAFMHRFLST